MASEYKKRGGDYTTDKKDDSAKHLDKWTEEEWQTKEGSGSAKDENGLEHRYLPKKAWEQMSEKEKEETDAKKQVSAPTGRCRSPIPVPGAAVARDRRAGALGSARAVLCTGTAATRSRRRLADEASMARTHPLWG